MTLPNDTAALIHESWAVLARDPDALTAGFYEELFRIAPHFRSMFAGTDRPVQRKKLAAALALIVRNAEDLGPVTTSLQKMGRRHSGYGVRDDDYAIVGAALLTMIERLLGPIFNADVRAAWATAYGAVAAAMQSGAAVPKRSVA